ncbi:MAG: hypothetical protein QM770_14520 [Tepidisphaeraceae bacterium]
MLAVVKLARVLEHAAVDRVPQQAVVLGTGERPAVPRGQAELGHRRDQPIEREVARGVELERLMDQGATDRVGQDRPRRGVVHVADGGELRPNAITDLLPLAAADVLREVVDVVLAHAEAEREHELAVGRRLEVERRELQVAKLPGVDEIDEPAAVEAVPRQPVRVPREDADGLARFDPVEHRVKDRTPRLLGALLLREDIDHFDLLACREFAEFRELVLDRPLLTRKVIRRLPCVNEELRRDVSHRSSIAKHGITGNEDMALLRHT